MYYIYHIPEWQYKDGTVGCIGCTQNIKGSNKRRRLIIAERNNWMWSVIEIHNNRIEAGKRERELQQQYGCRMDKDRYEHVTTKMLEASLSKKGITNRKKSQSKRIQTKRHPSTAVNFIQRGRLYKEISTGFIGYAYQMRDKFNLADDTTIFYSVKINSPIRRGKNKGLHFVIVDTPSL